MVCKLDDVMRINHSLAQKLALLIAASSIAIQNSSAQLPAGTAVRFEPGDEQEVELVTIAGSREIYGFNGLVEGQLNLNLSEAEKQEKKEKVKKDKKDKGKKKK